MKIDMKKITEKIRIWAKNAINSALPTLKKWIEDRTPEDTKTLVSSYQVKEATTSDTQGIISTSVNYAKYVEYWVWRVYNYQKPRWNKGWYRWNGARMFVIWYENTRQAIIQKLKDWFTL